MSIRKKMITFLAVVMASVTLTACGGGSSNQADQSCFSQLTSDQEQQLRSYVASNGDQSSSNGDGTVCVLDNSGNEHYYRQQDNFSNYLLYSAMFGQSRTLATYGLISGDLSPMQYIALQSLTSINRQGYAYHPYGYSNNRWNHQDYSPTTRIQNVHVTNVYYGQSTTPVSFKQAYSSPPKQYKQYSNTRLPNATDQAASVSKSSGGKTTVSTVKGSSTSKSYTNSNPGSSNTRPKSGSGTSSVSKSYGGGSRK